MKIKALIATALTLAVALVGVALYLNWQADSAPTSVADPAATAAPQGSQGPSATASTGSKASSSATTGEGSSASAAPQATGAPEPSGTKDSSTAPKASDQPTAQATRPSWNPQPSESQVGLEVPTPTKASKFALPSTEERAPVLTKAPAIGVKEGKLTKGFPTAALPLPSATSIVQSSVAKQGELVMLGLEGRSKSSTDEVLDFYAVHFKKLNWLSERSTPAEGTTQITGGFGTDSATITVRKLPTGQTAVSAAGVFKVAG
ncbi:hypothetical protein SLW73_07245 [Glutamicibacter protophormiae]|uniref:hypothetical protein n=1 Tax=Glutamicibacter protophormiae TaxID=37930 RepID=UPI002A7F18BA|nr:hypothetical protein [Glutamicibacter protophormiae]WPR66105.1 hypothetical protein SLW72_07250 [Glutamicibacter protophormiae]WPR69602.1 hypothetical protein SLW73_07245 [Glutamicibacter protophormiae]